MEDGVKIEVRWEGEEGKSRWFPTEEYKHDLIKDCAQRYGLTTFIETGTCEGQTTEMASHHFKTVYSIELGEYYYNKAVEKFVDFGNVALIHGNSNIELPKLLGRIPVEPTLFYLDAHFSGGHTAPSRTPLREEIEAICKSKLPGIILIDDMQGYWNHVPNPEVMTDMVKQYTDWDFEFKNGLMRIWRKA